MAMCAMWFQFPPGVDEARWRARLRAEIGARASERNVEVSWDDGRLELLSQDFVVLAYAGKVSLALGGQATSPRFDRPRAFVPAPWTATPWVELPWWRRLRLWIGPTASSATPPAEPRP